MNRKERSIPTELPVICLDASLMVFPGLYTRLYGQDPKTILDFMNNFGITTELPWVITVMSNPKEENFPDKFYRTGVVSKIEVDTENGSMIIRGLYRAQILDFKSVYLDVEGGGDNPSHYLATIKYLHDENCDEYFVNSEVAIRGSLFVIRKVFLQYLKEIREVCDITNLAINVSNIKKLDYKDKDAIDELVWAILYHMPSEVMSQERQVFLESDNLIERVELLGKLVDKHLRIALFANEHFRSLSEKSRTKLLRGDIDQPQNNKADESVEKDDQGGFDAKTEPELFERWERYKKIRDTLDPEAQEAILEDFARIRGNHSGQSEFELFLNHLDCLLDIYSAVTTPQEKDISKVEKILDESHFGLEDVKSEIYNHLAVKTLNPTGKAPILCFVGPPGVGKTSIGKSIAEALGLKFTRKSLGGVRDEADIRGHRQTYIGAIPGQIIQEIRRMGVKNPVFMLDEIDKLNNDFRGDPSSALLEVLDPEQNHSFQDHYVGAPYDLSGVLFLCTANTESSIQPALHDRMNVVHVSGYTELEKVQIAKKFLIPKQLAEVGLSSKGVKLCWPDNNPDPIISKIISGYTREAGVRELERQIHKALSIWARQYLKEDDDKKSTEILITEELVEKLLGAPKWTHERANVTEIGEAIGLAWTPVGGDILYIQAALLPFTGKMLSLTGSQGKVMIEACKVAMSRLRIYLERAGKTSLIKNKTVHIHIPQGAVPKDGPSAGITTFCALYSEAFGLKVKPLITMTGELTLKGMVTRVGGIKEKILAAHRDGIREVILPASNKRDVDKDIPEEIKKDLKFYFITHDEEALPIVFPEN